MVALIDCNNFFVSCELTVRPELRGRPVIVGGRGDNGGCAIAMSNEAKALGIPRGIPIFKIRRQIDSEGIVVLPGNHALYSSISRRVMATVTRLGLPTEIYSIDEAFLHIPFVGSEATDFCRYVRERIDDETGIPTGIGIASTKTLAKMAATFAKRYKGYGGVCLMDTPEKIARALSMTRAGDVWGIGRKLLRRLERIGVVTAADFAALPVETVERHFAAPVAMTWHELHGRYMFDESTHRRRYHSCRCSRTFDHDIVDRSELERRVSVYAENVAASLRRHRRLALEIEVMLATNPYHTDAPQRHGTAKVRLDSPSADSMVIAAATRRAFAEAYAPGYAYKRAGVTALRTIGEEERQPGLFDDPAATEKSRRLMDTLDRLNASGLGVKLASSSGNTSQPPD